MRNQPRACAVEQHAGSVGTGPAQRIQPSIEAELDCRIVKFAIATAPANLSRMLAPLPANAIFGKATWPLDAQLPRQGRHDGVRGLGQIVRKRAEITGRAELHGKTQPVVIASVMGDETVIAVIEMKISREVPRIWFTVEPAIAPPLLIRQKPDRHRDSPPPGVAKVRTFAAWPKLTFYWRFWFAKL